ncbi:MAG: hypothetical protein WDA26_01455 [Pusillimonas sp.]
MNSQLNWSKMPIEFKEKYEKKSSRSELNNALFLGIINLDWIKFDKANTLAYSVFAKEVNRIELSINLFENLLNFEDVRHENKGIDDFLIDIPRHYFRFPGNNCVRPHVPFSGKEFTDDERQQIESIILESRNAMPLRNDENIVREHFHRLEFLAIFSYFEAFLERFLSDTIWDGSEESRKKANGIVMKNSLPIALQTVIKEINPEIENLLKYIEPQIFNILHFCYLIRNVHTHNLGQATNYMIKNGLDYGSLKEEEIRDADGNLLYKDLCTTYSEFGKHRIEKGNYMTLSAPVSLLRSHSKEIAYILDTSFT